MGVLELTLAVVIIVSAGVASGVPFAAFGRTRDLRLLLVGVSELAMLALGVVWLYGQLPVSPPAYTATTLPSAALVTIVSVCMLGTGVLRRRG